MSFDARVHISVLIATRNRARVLRSTLESLASQQAPDLLREVIVADNGSLDDTSVVLGEMEHKLPLRHVFVAYAGKNRALNEALGLAKGELLVFTDDDVEIPASWLSDLWSASRRWPDYDIFGGPVLPCFPPGTDPWLKDPDVPGYLYARFSLAQEEGPCGAQLPIGPNFAIRARALRAAYFSPCLGPQRGSYIPGGETELLTRLVLRGHRAVYVPSAQVSHRVRPEQLRLRWILARTFRFGRGQAFFKAATAMRQRGGARSLHLRALATIARTALRALAAVPSPSTRRVAWLPVAFHVGFLYQLLRRHFWEPSGVEKPADIQGRVVPPQSTL